MEPQLAAFVRDCCSKVNRQLEEILTPVGPASQLYEAMRYSVLSGGKRIRPVLVYAAAQAIIGEKGTASDPNIDRIASAVELIHAYSLIHDDLPAMDDDDLRRGKPTCHVAFDEPTAILAGDALQCLAFQQLSEINCPNPLLVVKLVKVLACASGANGMAGGQMIDMNSIGQNLSLSDIKTMHQLKTGALISASIDMGALISTAATSSQLEALSRYGALTGLAFQVKDDIMDVEETTIQSLKV